MNFITKILIEFRCKLFKEIRLFKKLFNNLKNSINNLNYQEIYNTCIWKTRLKEIERCIQSLENIGR